MNREIETRVLVIAEMLDRAVDELKRLATEIQNTAPINKDTSQERER